MVEFEGPSATEVALSFVKLPFRRARGVAGYGFVGIKDANILIRITISPLAKLGLAQKQEELYLRLLSPWRRCKLAVTDDSRAPLPTA